MLYSSSIQLTVPDDYADYFMYRHWYDHQQVAARDPKTAANALPPKLIARMEEDFGRSKIGIAF